MNNHDLFYEMIIDIQKLHFRMTGSQNWPIEKHRYTQECALHHRK